MLTPRMGSRPHVKPGACGGADATSAHPAASSVIKDNRTAVSGVWVSYTPGLAGRLNRRVSAADAPALAETGDLDQSEVPLRRNQFTASLATKV